MNRSETIQTASKDVQDILIIGAGINGAVSAACLAAQGYQVTLIDKNDFASATSQESSNLVWGGIKYLENYEFGLVRHLCKSRNKLMRAYPTQIKEIRFFATHSKNDTHALITYWFGCWFYWLLGSGYTQKPKKIPLKKIKEIEDCLITDQSDGAIEYSDSYLPENDSRFVYKFAQCAQIHKASIINYCEALSSNRKDDLWETICTNQLTKEVFVIRSKIIINCGGPYADTINQKNKMETKYNHVLSKGIHLIVPRIQKTNKVLTFLSDDKRPFYVIPMKNCSCIGTTDTPSPTANVQVSDAERDFVLDNINKRVRLDKKLTKDDIIGERCGVRPLALLKGNTSNQDWFAISRHHKIEPNEKSKYISIFGGKLTDCLNIADEINELVSKWLPKISPKNNSWYGEPSEIEKQKFTNLCKGVLTDTESERVWNRYGLYAHQIFDILKNNSKATQKIFEHAEYYFYDFILMSQTENIEKLEDILRRRTSLSLTTPFSTMKNNQKLKEICQFIFPQNAEEKWQEYFSERRL